MTDLGICGHPLKTKPCGREPLWAGGKCSRHGFGAETLDQWIVGVSKTDDWWRPGLYITAVGAGTLQLDKGGRTWRRRSRLDDLEPGSDAWVAVYWYVTRNRTQCADGYLDPEDAAVLADMLEAQGYGADPGSRAARAIDEIRRAVAKAMRAKMRLAREDEAAKSAAVRLREAGIHAIAVDDVLVIPRDSIEALVRSVRPA